MNTSVIGYPFDLVWRNSTLYVTDNSMSRVLACSLTGECSTIMTVSNPRGLAFNSRGDLFVASNGQLAIHTLAVNGVQSVYVSNIGAVASIAFDEADNLFITQQTLATVIRVPPGGQSKTTFATGLSGARGICFDAQGTKYIGATDISQIVAFSAVGTRSTYVASAPFVKGMIFHSGLLYWVSSSDPPAIPRVFVMVPSDDGSTGAPNDGSTGRPNDGSTGAPNDGSTGRPNDGSTGQMNDGSTGSTSDDSYSIGARIFANLSAPAYGLAFDDANNMYVASASGIIKVRHTRNSSHVT